MDQTTAIALANEVRRQELKAKIAKLTGNAETQASIASLLATNNNDTLRRLQSAQNELAALESGAGPGITEDFGMRTSVDNFCTQERTVGQGAAIDFIKAHPDCTEAEAIAAWEAGVAKWLPEGKQATHRPEGILTLYTANLAAWGKIPEPTWEAFRAVVVVTDKAVLMGM